MKYKIISLIMAVSTLAAVVFASCEDNQSNGEETTSPEEVVTTETNENTTSPETTLEVETTVPVTTAEPEPEINTITISFVGDCLLATYKGGRASGSFNRFAETAEPSHFFAKVYDIFAADDFTVANCENVFTDSNLQEVAKDHSPAYWYRSPKKNAKIFSAGSVELVSVSNNHTNDYGTKGAKDTKDALEAAGVEWGESSKPIIVEKYGVKIAIYMTGMWGEYRTTALSKKISELEEVSDYQVIYYHGGTERKYTPDAWRVRASKKLIDAGADLVIGNHPHVIQPMETYNGKDILYSLGNFLFGGSVRDDKFTIIYQKVLTVCEGEIIGEDYNIIPVYEYEGEKNVLWQPVPMTEGSEDYNSVIDFMHGKVKTPRG
ncbi:MAG: CapA family protein [Clostridia bacterium]|nr:CapA family protein [Clostridia bacterium]